MAEPSARLELTDNEGARALAGGRSENLRLIERFTRTAPDTLLYEFTVDDPTAFTHVWKGEVPFTKAPGPIYEYACHEGNYSMAGILKGARAQESTAAQTKEK